MRSKISLLVLTVFLASVALSASACKVRGFKEKPYPTPRVIVDTPSGAQAQDVELTYRLIEVDGSKSDITLEFSTDGGASWNPGTVKSGGSGVQGYPFPGITRKIAWDSFADGLSGTQTVRVKLSAAKSLTGLKGTPDATEDFQLQNPDFPVISWISKPEGAVRQVPLTFTWQLDTPATPIADYYYGLDEDPPTSTTANTFVTIPAPSLGAHVFRVFAGSTSGLNSTVLTAPFTCDNSAANQAPTVIITNGPSGTTTDNTPTFEYIGGDGDGSVAGYFVSVDVNPPTTWTTSTTWTSAELSYAPHTFYVMAQDNEGKNSAVISQSFTVEVWINQPPTVTILTGPSGTTTDSTPTFTYEGLDNDGTIAGYFVSIDVNPPGIWTTQSSWTSSELSCGSHAFYVMAQDNDGANSKIATRTFSCSGSLSPGDLVWAKNAGGTSSDYGYDIAALPDGSSLVTGRFSSTTTFGSGEANEKVLVASGGSDVFLARYNPDGSLNWVKKAGGTNNDYGYCISALPDGTALVTGYFRSSSITFGAGEANQTTLSCTSAGKYDIFVARYNSNGTLAWAKKAGGVNDDYGDSISALADGSCVVTGSFSNATATFGPGEGGQTTLTSSGLSDIFIAKYNSNGTLAWAKSAGGTGNDAGRGAATIADGTSFFTGYFSTTATFGAGEGNETSLTVMPAPPNSDVFIARYSPSGSLVWAKKAGSNGSDRGEEIAALADGSTLVIGSFYEYILKLGVGEANETLLPNSGMSDVFIARYNPDGTLAWARRPFGTNNDYGWDIFALPDGSSFITGDFSSLKLIFDDGLPTKKRIYAFIDEIFVARLNPDGTLAWARSAGATNNDNGYGVSAILDGSAFVTGCFEYDATFGLGEAFETELTAFGNRDIFVARFSPIGF